MKKYKMRISEIITAFALMLLLSACSITSISQTGEPKNADESIAIENTSEDIEVLASSEINLENDDTHECAEEEMDNTLAVIEDPEADIAFGKKLWDAFYLAKMEGIEYGEPKFEGHDEASFAIYDVDGDSKNELIISWPGEAMASYVTYIWGYENGNTHVELTEFPALTYYDNHTIKAEWSHNQGLAGENFWPYTLYKYNPNTDIYDCIGGADAWDKSFWDKDSRGNTFPDDIDKDGDGFVFYVFPADRVGYYDIPPVDGDEYKKWKDNILKDANEITIPFTGMTDESISRLGAPKPEYNFLETAG